MHLLGEKKEDKGRVKLHWPFVIKVEIGLCEVLRRIFLQLMKESHSRLNQLGFIKAHFRLGVFLNSEKLN